jgi:ABC-type lipoprotein release transport system permease subunit
MNPLSTWTYFKRHRGHAALLLSLSIIVTLGLYTMVALIWGVFVEPGRLVNMSFSKLNMVTCWSAEKGSEPEAITRIQNHPDIARVIPTTAINLQLPGMVGSGSFQFILLGLMHDDIPYILDRFDASLKVGHLPEPGMNELLLSSDLANILGVREGEIYDVLSSEFYSSLEVPLESTPFVVSGILKSEVELAIVSLEYLDNHELYRQFPNRFLVIAQEDHESEIDEYLRNEIQGTNISVITYSLLNERIISEALPALVMLLPVILVVAIAFSLVIVVVNNITNARRLPAFGILHAAGLSKRWLTRRFTAEAASVAIMGWIIGIGLSWGFLYLLKVTAFATQGYDLDYVVWLPIVFSLPAPLTITGFAFITFRKTFSRLDPVTIIEQGELSQEEERKRRDSTSKSSFKPLSPATYYKRHRRRGILLIGGMSLMILALVLFIFALSVNADANESFLSYLRQVNIVRSPGIVTSLDPDVVNRVASHPAVERVIPFAPRNSMLSIYIPPFLTVESNPFAVYTQDMAYLIDLYGLELKSGRLPRSGTNEMVIPESLAQNRDLEIGDVIGDPNRPVYPGAPSLPSEFIISGIFMGNDSAGNENSWGFISLEYLEQNEIFPLPDVLPLIVVPKTGQKDVLDEWMESEWTGSDASVITYQQEVTRIRQKVQQDMISIALLEAILAVIAAIGLAVLNYIFTSQRQSEFGVLYALGHSRRWLVGRVLGETSFTVVFSWGLSIVAAMIFFLALRYGIYEPRGLTFDVLNITPWLYTLPIPIAVLLVTAGSTAWTFSKLDPISIIEHRA